MDIRNTAELLVEIRYAVKTCIEKGKYDEAAQLAAAYASILSGMGEKQVTKLFDLG